MNLTDIANREQAVRGTLKAKRHARVIAQKELDALDLGIAADLEELADLRQHANAAFDTAGRAGEPEPSPTLPPPCVSEAASGEGPLQPASPDALPSVFDATLTPHRSIGLTASNAYENGEARV